LAGDGGRDPAPLAGGLQPPRLRLAGGAAPMAGAASRRSRGLLRGPAAPTPAPVGRRRAGPAGGGDGHPGAGRRPLRGDARWGRATSPTTLARGGRRASSSPSTPWRGPSIFAGAAIRARPTPAPWYPLLPFATPC